MVFFGKRGIVLNLQWELYLQQSGVEGWDGCIVALIRGSTLPLSSFYYITNLFQGSNTVLVKEIQLLHVTQQILASSTVDSPLTVMSGARASINAALAADHATWVSSNVSTDPFYAQLCRRPFRPMAGYS